MTFKDDAPLPRGWFKSIDPNAPVAVVTGPDGNGAVGYLLSWEQQYITISAYNLMDPKAERIFRAMRINAIVTATIDPDEVRHAFAYCGTEWDGGDQ